MKSESELKRFARGSQDMKCEVNQGIAAARWLDNKAVQLYLILVRNELIGTCRRWSTKEKQLIASRDQLF